ncbi:DUF169 domain-containing protein [Archaeoglobus sp.]
MKDIFKNIFGTNNLKKVAKAIDEKLAASPVAIRLVFEGEDLRGEIHPISRICAAIDRAKNDSFILLHSSLTCPIAKFVLRGEGKEEATEKLFKEKLVSSEKAAKNLINSIPHFKGNIIGLQLSPVEKAKFKPDVLVFILNPRDAMRLAQTLAYNGRPIRAEFSGITAACGEIIAMPIKEKRPNLSLGCKGSRRFLKDSELLFSVPYTLISRLLEGEYGNEI